MNSFVADNIPKYCSHQVDYRRDTITEWSPTPTQSCALWSQAPRATPPSRLIWSPRHYTQPAAGPTSKGTLQLPRSSLGLALARLPHRPQPLLCPRAASRSATPATRALLPGPLLHLRVGNLRGSRRCRRVGARGSPPPPHNRPGDRRTSGRAGTAGVARLAGGGAGAGREFGGSKTPVGDVLRTLRTREVVPASSSQ